MVELQARPIADVIPQKYETPYVTDYARWNGFVARNAVLKSIIDIRAASIFSSWKTHGPHDEEAAEALDAWRGRGNETFKLIMANLYKIAYTCGDAYGELIYDGDTPVDCEVLPSDNVRQIIKNGKIIRFEEVNGNAKWSPERIFHLRYHPRGAMSHGIGQIEAMQNILVDYEQMLQQGSEIFMQFTKPMLLIFTTSDRKEKMQDIRDQIKDAENTFSKTIIMPRGLIDKVDPVQLAVPLKPGEWLKELRAEIFMATQTPEIVLGTGYSTSEEDAKTRIAGFRGSIRYDQKWIEEHIRQQIFGQMWPDDPPDIQFSFATEAQDERFNRMLEAANTIQAWNISPENKTAMVADALTEAGLLEE